MRKPDKLSWVTVNLYIYLALNILIIVAAIVGGALAGTILGASGTNEQDSLVGLIIGFVFGVGGVLMGALGAVAHFLAARGIQQGKRWGWILSMVLMVLNVISYIGTLLLAIPAVLGLVGLLDRDVQDYAKN